MNEGPFRIEYGIEMPRPNGRDKYPWKKMKPGGSFLVPCGNFETLELMHSLTSCARNAEKKTGSKFAMRKVEGGVRVWRLR